MYSGLVRLGAKGREARRRRSIGEEGGMTDETWPVSSRKLRKPAIRLSEIGS